LHSGPDCGERFIFAEIVFVLRLHATVIIEAIIEIVVIKTIVAFVIRTIMFEATDRELMSD